MLQLPEVLLLAAMAAVAFLYAAVGHAGASGYIAVMAVAGTTPEVIKPTALALNVAVAALGTWQFLRAGHWPGRRFWPVLITGMPAAFVGGALDLPTLWFQRLVGVVLLVSALRFLTQPRDPVAVHVPSVAALVLAGGLLGLMAGLTGTGGGVFLTPMLLLMGWCTTKQAAATSALFILLNSIAGLSGLLLSRVGRGWPLLAPLVWPALVVVVAAGGIGARLGSHHLPVVAVRRLLAVVLLVAGLKLIGAQT